MLAESRNAKSEDKPEAAFAQPRSPSDFVAPSMIVYHSLIYLGPLCLLGESLFLSGRPLFSCAEARLDASLSANYDSFNLPCASPTDHSTSLYLFSTWLRRLPPTAHTYSLRRTNF